ncbi:hypothetical protein E5K00_00595 [Hymenobacter aquaticus]|uniref:Uncharacterized protein n=1 Tax=Hymenobacter aquaticus TaxID=1867101 RepID=A0A4Z0Q234_9BACT|nr:hypothetical protein [Hymenobacter aquaticus]TGE23745.1 hypothetical protein E5K00_00595 [Hymenobacter aquaticus]
MTSTLIAIILTFLTLPSIYGQTKATSCDCPKTQYAGTKSDTTFHLSNGKTIVLCGYKNPDSKPATFSEFILAACGQGKIINFWGATLTCRLRVNKDVLLVDNLRNLPTGKGLKYQETVWTTEKIFFSGQKVIREVTVNRQIRKYSQDEIQTVLKMYKTATPGLNDSKMKLANKLFIATISGNKNARQYFKEFKSRFGTLDGAFAEEYHDLTAMLELWDRKE